VAQSVLGLQFLNSDVQLLHLATHLAYSRFDARAPSTVSKHALLWRRFTAWMAARVPPVRALNTPSELVALYLTRLRLESAALSLGPSRVLEASAAIACHHALFGCVSPTNHPPILVVGFLWPSWEASIVQFFGCDSSSARVNINAIVRLCTWIVAPSFDQSFVCALTIN
jgi:hypothetical protein